MVQEHLAVAQDRVPVVDLLDLLELARGVARVLRVVGVAKIAIVVEHEGTSQLIRMNDAALPGDLPGRVVLTLDHSVRLVEGEAAHVDALRIELGLVDRVAGGVVLVRLAVQRITVDREVVVATHQSTGGVVLTDLGVRAMGTRRYLVHHVPVPRVDDLALEGIVLVLVCLLDDQAPFGVVFEDGDLGRYETTRGDVSPTLAQDLPVVAVGPCTVVLPLVPVCVVASPEGPLTIGTLVNHTNRTPTFVRDLVRVRQLHRADVGTVHLALARIPAPVEVDHRVPAGDVRVVREVRLERRVVHKAIMPELRDEALARGHEVVAAEVNLAASVVERPVVGHEHTLRATDVVVLRAHDHVALLVEELVVPTPVAPRLGDRERRVCAVLQVVDLVVRGEAPRNVLLAEEREGTDEAAHVVRLLRVVEDTTLVPLPMAVFRTALGRRIGTLHRTLVAVTASTHQSTDHDRIEKSHGIPPSLLPVIDALSKSEKM